MLFNSPFRTYGATSAESTTSDASPGPLLLSPRDGHIVHGSGLTTPLSFMGAFSSGGGGSPAWFEGQQVGTGGVNGGGSASSNTGNNSGSSSATGPGSGTNSISDALHLLLQGITMPGEVVVPTVAQRLPAVAETEAGAGVEMEAENCKFKKI